MRHLVYSSLLWLALALIVLIGTGCDSSDLQREFEEEAGELPAGITRTDDGGALVRDAQGNPVEVDSADWQTGPLYVGSVRLDPAYPNPTRGGVITLPFVTPFSTGIAGPLRLRGFDNTGVFVLLDIVEDAGLPGSWTFTFSPSLLSASGDLSSIRGLHRLFITDPQGRLVSYGDLLIE